MTNTCVILVLFVAFVSCTLSSYLDIPPPPERPFRFKTKEQIENYLKAVKDYYDAFKIKLVRRQNSISDLYTNIDRSTNYDNMEALDEQLHIFNRLYNNYKQHHPTRNMFEQRKKNHVK